MVDDSANEASQETSASPGATAPLPAAGSLPPTDPDGTLNFYFLDAFEDEQNAPGNVYLFGKVAVDGGHASCCVQLKVPITIA